MRTALTKESMMLQKMIKISFTRLNVTSKGENRIIGGIVIVCMVGHFKFMSMLTSMNIKKTLESPFKFCLRNEKIPSMIIRTGAHPSNLMKRRKRISMTTRFLRM